MVDAAPEVLYSAIDKLCAGKIPEKATEPLVFEPAMVKFDPAMVLVPFLTSNVQLCPEPGAVDKFTTKRPLVQPNAFRVATSVGPEAGV